jgi:sugar/nucleoside kinase (ribokinase family)
MSRIGIFTRHVQKDPEKPTGLCVTPVTPDGERILIVARGANASLDKEAVRAALHNINHLHVSGYALAEPGVRMAAVEALRAAQQGGATTSLDFTWHAAVSASEAIREALAHVTVALPSAAELRIALGFRQLSRAAEAAHELGAEQVAATLGVGGCRVFSVRGAFRAPPFEARVVNTYAFSAGYIFGLLQSASPEACGVIGNAAGAAAAGSEHPHESLDRKRVVQLLRDGENRARRKKHIEAIREAIKLLSKRGHAKRKADRPSKSRRLNT